MNNAMLKLRDEFFKMISEYKGDKLFKLSHITDKELLKHLIFNPVFNENGKIDHYELLNNSNDRNRFYYESIIRKIDFSDISFDNVDIRNKNNGLRTNLSLYHNAKINPQTIYNKDLSWCNFDGIEFIGNFDGTKIDHTIFKNSKNAKINPQTIYDKQLSGCLFENVEFIGNFDGVKLTTKNRGLNYSVNDKVYFKGSIGAKINPQTIYDKNLSASDFSDVEFIGPFDDCYIMGSNFIGAKNVKMDVQKVKEKILSGCSFKNVDFSGISFDGASINGTKFHDCENVTINPNKLKKYNGIINISSAYLKNVRFIETLDGNEFCITGTQFEKCTGVKINPQYAVSLYESISKDKNLTNCSFDSVEFIGPFDETLIHNSNFKGSIGAKINPNSLKDSEINMDTKTIKFKDIRNCNFDDVEFIGPIEKCLIQNTSFNGSVGATIDPNSNNDISYIGRTSGKRAYKDCDFYGVEFTGSFDDSYIANSNFKGSIGAKINPNKTNLRGCWNGGNVTILDGVEFTDKFIDYPFVTGLDFTGSKNAQIFLDNIMEMHLNDFNGVTFTGNTNRFIELDNNSFDNSNVTINSKNGKLEYISTNKEEDKKINESKFEIDKESLEKLKEEIGGIMSEYISDKDNNKKL